MIHNPTEREAIHKVGLIFEREFHWAFRNQPEQDFGIDAQVEIIEEGFPTGRLIGLQIKSGKSWFRKETERGFVYRGSARHLDYWRNHSLPVVLVLYDPTIQVAFWEVVRDELVEKTFSGWKITVPKNKRLSRTALAELRALAGPPGDSKPTPPAKQTTGDIEKEKLVQYLSSLIKILSELPPYFDKHFDAENIRQRVRVSRKRLTYLDVIATASEADRRSGYFDEDESPKQGYLLRGSEAYQEVEPNTATVVDWDQHRASVDRAVILGDPGFGKTWLLKHEGLRVAKGQLNCLRDSFDKSIDVLPVFLRLGTIADRLWENNANLAWTIGDLVAEKSDLPPDWLAKQVVDGKCLLLLDALDEVDSQVRPKLAESLEHLTQTTQNRILLTSRLVGYRAPFSLRSTDRDQELEIVAFDREQTEGFIDSWFANSPGRARKLKQTLRRQNTLGGLARVPLLLSFICLLAGDDQPLPTRRVELYETLISYLLEGRWREKSLQDHNPERTEAKLLLLEEIGWHFATETPDKHWQDLMTADEISRTIASSKYSALISGSLPNQGSVLLELSEKDGLLVKAGSSVLEAERQIPYLFLHRTFHEYFVASYLSRLPIEDALAFVKKHWWYDPEWEEVVVLLAGRMPNPSPLLEALLFEPNDLFNRMLILAGRCIAEVAHDKRPDGLEQYLTEEFITLLRERSSQAKKLARRVLLLLHNEQAMKALIALYHFDNSERSSLAEDLIQSDTPRAIEMLKESLGSVDSHERKTAVISLTNLHEPEARELLWKALDDSDIKVRTQAAEALGDLSSQKVVAVLRDAVTPDGDLADVHGTIRAVAKVGGDQAATLLGSWFDLPNKYMRDLVIMEFRRVNGSNVHEILKKALGSPYFNVRAAAAVALLEHDDSEAIEVVEHAIDGTLLLSEMERLGASLQIDNILLEPVIAQIRKNEVSLRAAFRSQTMYGGEPAFSMLLGALVHPAIGVRWIAALLICALGQSQARHSTNRSLVYKHHGEGEERGCLTRVSFLLINRKNSRSDLKYLLIYDALLRRLTRAVQISAEGDEIPSLSNVQDHLDLPQQTVRALKSLKNTQATKVLVATLGKSSIDKEVIEALGERADEGAINALWSTLDKSELDVQIEVCGALKDRANEVVFRVLRRALSESTMALRLNAVRALGEIGVEEAREMLRELLVDKEREVRVAAARSLRAAGGDTAVAVWADELKQKEGHPMEHYLVANELGKIGNEKAIAALLSSLRKSSSAYFGASTALQGIARGRVAVRVFEHVLQSWPRYDTRKQGIYEDLLSSLAPEVCRSVGDEWPAWRERFVKVTHPGPGVVQRLVVSLLLIVLWLPARLVRILRSQKST